MSVVMGPQLEGLEEIFGIKQIRTIDVHIGFDEVVSAKVEFLLDLVQAKAFVELCSDGKWRSPPLNTPPEATETTTMDSTGSYKTFATTKKTKW